MKRLIISLVFVLAVVASIGSVSAIEQWKFQMFEPSATTQRTLNIEYKVLSIDADDTFTIKLFQNGTEVATQNVTTPYGDSGVFITSIPASGIYTYKTTALNGTEEKSETRTVQITNAPEPIVTIVNTATPRAATSQLNPAGATNPASQNAGQVGDGATTTDKKPTDVLSDSNKKPKNKNQSWGSAVVVILILFAAAGGYYYMVMRKANKD